MKLPFSLGSFSVSHKTAKRGILLLILFTGILTLFYTGFSPFVDLYHQARLQIAKQGVVQDPELPPLYERFTEAESALPQHELYLHDDSPDSPRYFWAANHVWGE